MNEPEIQKLMELGWRRSLSPEEQARVEAWLAVHPDSRSGWDDESAPYRGLGKSG